MFRQDRVQWQLLLVKGEYVGMAATVQFVDSHQPSKTRYMSMRFEIDYNSIILLHNMPCNIANTLSKPWIHSVNKVACSWIWHWWLPCGVVPLASNDIFEIVLTCIIWCNVRFCSLTNICNVLGCTYQTQRSVHFHSKVILPSRKCVRPINHICIIDAKKLFLKLRLIIAVYGS